MASGKAAGGGEAFDLREALEISVLSHSEEMEPFKVTFDPGCEFCRKNRQIVLVSEEYEHPEPTFIARLPVSVAALSYDQTYPGRTLVILRDHVADLNEMLKTRLPLYIAFMEDVSTTVDAIRLSCSPDRLNYAIYMNQNKHLHVHLIPRYLREGKAYNDPPPFRGVDRLMPGYDYRSLATDIRRHMKRNPSPLSRYCEQLINDGLPP